MIDENMSDGAIRGELGERIQAFRLMKNQDQESFAYEAGISVSTLYRLEKGSSVSFDVYIKVLRELGLLSRLESLVPSAEPGPVQQVRQKQVVPRQRASGSRKAPASSSSWQGFKQQVSFDDKDEA